jgi:hypothetical protein
MKKKSNLIGYDNPSDRRNFLKKASYGSLGLGLLVKNAEEIISTGFEDSHSESASSSKIKLQISGLP